MELKSEEKYEVQIGIVSSREDLKKPSDKGESSRIYCIPFTPGTYEIQWTYYTKRLLANMPEDLISNTVTIEITQE